MKKGLITLGFAALALGANAQVKIKDGTVTGTSTIPNTTAILDLESNNKGLHLPRVSLQATNSPKPLNETNFNTSDSGLVVYNTETINDVSPGIYYCNGTQWIRLIDVVATSSSAWNLTGNAGTTAGTNFIGTTDNQDLVFKTNGIQAGWLNIGNGNTAFGVNSLPTTITGTYNTALGDGAAGNQTSGNNNIAIGYGAAFPNAAGNYQLNIGNAIWGIGVDSLSSGIGSKIGIGAVPAPNSTLQVGGSVSLPITLPPFAFAALDSSMYTVIVRGNNGGIVSLPDPTTCQGRMYRIVNASLGGVSVNFAVQVSANFSILAGGSLLSPQVSITDINTILLQSDGTQWWKVGN